MPNPLHPVDTENDDLTSQPTTGGIAARALAAKSGGGKPDYFDGLNPEQIEAVESLDGPVLVLAGAGTGKTRVLTTRIAHILATGRAWPSQILAVTFTNKAAREMKDRIGRYVGDTVEGMPWLGTFHSIGVKMLRRNAELVDLNSDFTILDTDDQIRLLKQLIRAEGIDDKRWPARQLAGHIDSWKNKGLAPDQLSEGDARAFGDGKGGELYRQYQERLKILNACDFGDLLTETIRLFRENPEVLKDYQQRFKYILVDEYQDTNTAQYMWLRLLAQRTSPVPLEREEFDPAPMEKPIGFIRPSASQPLHVDTAASAAAETLATSQSATASADASTDVLAEEHTNPHNKCSPNICCVGDDDQSIYGWRGAEVDNILSVSKRIFQAAKVVRLESNYRSTPHIFWAQHPG